MKVLDPLGLRIAFFLLRPPEAFRYIFHALSISQGGQILRRLLEQLQGIEESVQDIPLVGGNQEDVGMRYSSAASIHADEILAI